MRDGLSLTDQAIAYSAGEVTEAAVRTMLGALDQTYLFRIMNCVVDEDGAALLSIADEIAARSLSFNAALQDLASLLHRVAVVQTVPGALGDDWANRGEIEALAARLGAEEVQLYYQIVTQGRSELGLAPDEFSGFSMTLLRLLAFRPAAVGTSQTTPAAAPTARVPMPVSRGDAIATPSSHAARAAQSAPPPAEAPEAAAAVGGIAAVRAALAAAQRPGTDRGRNMAPAVPVAAPKPLPTPVAAVAEPEPELPAAAVAPAVAFGGDWNALVAGLKVSGMAAQLARNAELVRFDSNRFHLRVATRGVLDAGAQEKLEAALSQHFGAAVKIAAEVGVLSGSTVAAIDQKERDGKMSQAVAAIDSDPFVQSLVREFGATVVPGSIRPVA